MIDQPQTAVLLFAHGSRIDEANDRVRDLARQVGKAGGSPYVRAAFLEIAQPGFSSAIEEAHRAGMRRILVIPYFLTMGVHLRIDLPALVSAELGRYPSLEIRVGDPLEGHPLLPSLILDRIHDVEEKHRSR
ncbi:MAG: sirohydrochlorin chelatase [Terriglobia bacterium]